MKQSLLLALTAVLFICQSKSQENKSSLPCEYNEITVSDFPAAIEKSNKVCIIPFGILEKHGLHLPVATDLYVSREVARRASEQEYFVIFPWYYFGQINEAKHQPGAIAYKHETIWALLQETCDELSRNGFKKIIIVNGHGGNNDFLNYFCLSQLEKERDYIFTVFQPKTDSVFDLQVKNLSKTTVDGHAGEQETSMMMVIHPELVKLDKATNQSGTDENLLQIPYQHTGIWWYAHFPNQYAGDGSKYSIELGNLLLKHDADQLVQLIRTIKKDNTIEKLQNKFFKDSKNPLDTKQ
jgi:creatinine amidohydrolase